MKQPTVEQRSRHIRGFSIVSAACLSTALVMACRSAGAAIHATSPTAQPPVVSEPPRESSASIEPVAALDIPNGAIVEGIVLEHGKPRAGCHVSISFPPRDWYRSESGRAYFTRTDADGRFRSSVQSGCARFDVLEGGVMHLQDELRCLNPGDHVTGIVLYIGAH